jgi:hypothetical protein
MSLPFSTDQFFAVFAAYNLAIWPAQIIAYILGLTGIAGLWLDRPIGRRLITSILAIFWGWNGAVYHFAHFSSINPAANVFALMFVVQAILFGVAAATSNDLQFKVGQNLRSVAGMGFILFALLIYEWLGWLAGHGLMKGPLFGVAPCPTTIFTIGMLLLARGSMVRWLSIIPVLWALIGSTAAVLLAVPEDLGLAVAAAALVGVLAIRRFNANSPTRKRPRA